METLLFYWSGVIMWYAIMACAIALVFAVCVWAPIRLQKWVYKSLWKWRLAKELSATGLTVEETRAAINLPISKVPAQLRGIDVNILLDWAKAVKEHSND